MLRRYNSILSYWKKRFYLRWKMQRDNAQFFIFFGGGPLRGSSQSSLRDRWVHFWQWSSMFWLFILGLNKIESGPKSELMLLVFKGWAIPVPSMPRWAMWCDTIVKHQLKQEAGGNDDQQRAQSGKKQYTGSCNSGAVALFFHCLYWYCSWF